jgi:hypothetical protein
MQAAFVGIMAVNHNAGDTLGFNVARYEVFTINQLDVSN